MPVQTHHIHSANATFQQLESLQHNRNKRHKTKRFLVEGVRNINHALQYNWRIDSFIYTQDRALSGWARDMLAAGHAQRHYVIAPHLQKTLSNKRDTSELLAVVQMPEDTTERITFAASPLILVIDRSGNPGNLGTIIRSADALGVDGIIMTGHSVDLYDPEVISASTGSFFALPVIRLSVQADLTAYLTNLQEDYTDVQLVGSSVNAETRLQHCNFLHPTVLFIGNETKGLSFAYQEMCDELIRIDMQGSASSLNVACATSIMLYEVQRQRLPS